MLFNVNKPETVACENKKKIMANTENWRKLVEIKEIIKNKKFLKNRVYD